MPMTLDQFIREMQTIPQREPLMRQAALRKGAEIVRDETQAMIGTEDTAWAVLADSTIAEKQRLGYVGQVSATDPLLRTGELRDSIEVGTVTPDRAVVGTADPISRYLEFGTARMPARSFLGAACFRKAPEIVHTIGVAASRLLRGRSDGE